MWQFPSVESLRQDTRYAIRSLVKAPGFSVVAILVLAIGIGANTAMFSLVDAMLLRGLPYAEADRLVGQRSSGAATHFRIIAIGAGCRRVSMTSRPTCPSA
jgi:hypothetical protein